MENVDAAGASFIEADLAGACFAGATMRCADLSASNLAQADFRGANLADATLEDAKGPGIVMDDADLTELRASGKTVFSGGSFKNVSARESIWEAADLSSCDFSFSKMEGASFAMAVLSRARMRAADMKNARFEKRILRMRTWYWPTFWRAILREPICHAAIAAKPICMVRSF